MNKKTSLRDTTAFASNLQAVLCGDILEVTLLPEIQTPTSSISPSESYTEGETEEMILQRSIARSQKAIRRLVNSNRLNVLHTLTFAITHPDYFDGEKPFELVPEVQQRSREAVLTEWRCFVRRMRKYAFKKRIAFKYIAIIERHTGKRLKSDNSIKEGTFHIHFCSDRVWPKRLLQSKWKHGFCNFSDWGKGRKSRDLANDYDLPPCDNPGVYMSKYTGKDMGDEGIGRKRYWASRNLDRPVKIGRDTLEELLKHSVQIWDHTSRVHFKNGHDMFIYKSTYKVPGEFFDRLKAQKPNEPDIIRTKKGRFRYELARQQAFRRFRKEERQEWEDIHRGTGQELVQRHLGWLITAHKRAEEAAKSFIL